MKKENKKELMLIKFTSVLSLTLIVLIVCLFFINPVAYVYLVAEDSWGEYATFVFYGVGFLMMLFIMLKNRNYIKPGYLLITFCFFFMAMEEISWGQRLIGLQTPESFGAINRQGETTVHNLVRVNRLFRILSIIILFWAMVFPFLIKKYEWVKKLVKKLGVPVCSKYLCPFFILSAFFILVRPLPRAVEIGELLMGFAFLAYSFDTLQISRKEHAPGLISLYVQMIIIGVFVIITTSFLVTNWPNNYALRIRYHDFAINELPERNMNKQSESIFRHVIDNPDLMTIEILTELKSIIKEQVDGVSEEDVIVSIVEGFSEIEDIHFNVFRKRKKFNLRKTDLDEQRALLLFDIGIEYYRLKDFIRAAGYFKNSLEYTSDKSLIDENNLSLSNALKLI